MPAFRCRGRIWNNPVQLALDTIGGKWKMPILWRLKDRTLRYAELRRSLNTHLVDAAITDRALTAQLRELEEHGLITRTVYPVVPPHVVYAITERGVAAIPVIRALQVYGGQVKAWEGSEDIPLDGTTTQP